MTLPRDLVRKIRRHTAPAWWRDAKLGVFVHWTPASVPAFAPTDGSVAELLAKGDPEAMAWSPYSEWYENSLRFPGSPAARHHAATYAGRDYQSFAAEFQAGLTGWDPEPWAELFARAGARYVVLVAKHHDGYCLWPTGVANPRRSGWSCRRDVVGELAEAVRNRGLRFGLYYSGGLDWTFNEHPIGSFSDLLLAQPRGDYTAYAEAQVRELIRRYKPSVLWNDISWPASEGRLASLLADYYREVPEGVVNDRFMPWSPLWSVAATPPARKLLDKAVAKSAAADKGIVPPKPPLFDVRTPEYTVFDRIQPGPWECVRGIDSSFGHNRAADPAAFIAREELVWSVVDIASKGGNLLLNVGPRGEDATIPPLQSLRLDWLATFMAGNGEALYATRPWVTPGHSSGDCDLRYTARDQTLFAFVRPTEPSGSLTVATLPEVDGSKATGVTTLSGVRLDHTQSADGLRITLGEPATGEVPACVALSGVTALPTPTLGA